MKGKGVLVLASGGGIGRGVASVFAAEGSNVMLFDRDEAALKESQAEIESKTGNKPHYFVGDITDPQSIKDLVATTVEKCGGIYALINNTGGPPPGTFDKFDDATWQKSFELTVLAYVRVIREVIPHMQKAGGGRIVNNSSSSIKRALDNLILSNVYRMGLLGLTKSLAREYGKDNIFVNILGPGKIKTSRVDQIDGVKAEKQGISLAEFQAKNAASVPVGRYGTPEDYGRLALYLCSEANTYITGQSMLVDGGDVDTY